MESEHEVLHAEAQYRELMYCKKLVVLEVNHDNTITFISPGVEPVLGFRPVELTGKPLSFLFSEKSTPGSKLKTKQHEDGLPCNLIEVARSDGGAVIMEPLSAPIIRNEEQIGSRWILYDLSEVYKNLHPLIRNFQTYKAACETANAFIVVIDDQQRIQYINQSALKVTGYEIESVEGKYLIDLLDKCSKSELEILFNLIRQNPDRNHDEYELFVKKKNGHRLLVRWNFKSLETVNGMQSSIIGVGIDITEAVKLNRQKHSLLYKVASVEKHAIIGQLSAAIAHEINNSLDVMMTQVSLLKMCLSQEDEESECWDHLVKLKQQLLRLNALGGNILNYAKPRLVQFEPVCVNTVLQHVIEHFSDKITLSALLIEKYTQDLPLVKGDRLGLEVAFKNLIRNAFEALKKTGEVVVRSYMEDADFIGVTIEDNGTGISRESLSRIFDPFFSTKLNRGGTGLGLPLCKKIIDQHDGIITIESAWRKGTIVRITLPKYKSCT